VYWLSDKISSRYDITGLSIQRSRLSVHFVCIGADHGSAADHADNPRDIHMIDHVDRALRTSQNALLGLHPGTDRLLQGLTQSYALSWIYTRTVATRLRHAAPIHPGRLFWVDPDVIQRTVSWTRISPARKRDEHPRFRAPNYRLAGRVFGGDWDRRDEYFSQSTIFQSFVAHFDRGVPWERTAFYEESVAAIENGATIWDCDTPDAFDGRCNELDRLYERIATDGYKTQAELRGRGHPIPDVDRLHSVIWGEIAVNVGRDGELVFLDGRNRLAIAKVQGLDAVPVVILVRHTQWQRLRNKIARGLVDLSELPADIRAHPDLVALY